MKGKEMKRNAEEETKQGADEVWASWAAGVLRPYMIVARSDDRA
jgi:hypothetical protein